MIIKTFLTFLVKRKDSRFSKGSQIHKEEIATKRGVQPVVASRSRRILSGHQTEEN